MRNPRENFILSGVICIVFGAFFSVAGIFALAGTVGISGVVLFIIGMGIKSDLGMSEKEIVNKSRLATLFFMVVAAVWAPQIVNFGGLWTYLQQMYSVFVPPVIVLFGVGIFYKRGNKEGAYWTLIGGCLLGVLFFVVFCSF